MRDPAGLLRATLTGTLPWDTAKGASLRFPAPAGAAITSVLVARATQGVKQVVPPPAGQATFSYGLETDGGTLEGCGGAPAAAVCANEFTGTFSRGGLSAKYAQLGIACAGTFPETCPAPADPAADPHLDVTRAAFTIADNTAPTLTNVRGALFGSALAKGIITVQFNAADSGGGLYRAFTLVDGKIVATQALDQHCTDVDTGAANPYEFSALQPCGQTLTDFTVPIDTTKLTEGVHTFAVQIEDAAGNHVTVAGPKGLRVENLNGVGADRKGRLKVWFVKTHKATAASVRGERVVIRGHRKLLFVYRVKRPGPATSKQHLLLTITFPSGKPLYRPAH